MVRGLSVSAMVVALLPSWTARSDARCEGDPTFPFLTGMTWTYAGTARWTLPSEGRAPSVVKTGSVRWTSRVVDAFQSGDVAGALVRDAAWNTQTPGFSSHDETLILRVGCRYYRIIVGAHGLFAAVKAHGRAAFAKVADDLDGWFDVPLTPGRILRPRLYRKFGTATGWLVTRAPRGFWLGFATAAGYEVLVLVPGIGVTEYVYHHNGTADDSDVHLVAFHVGGAR